MSPTSRRQFCSIRDARRCPWPRSELQMAAERLDGQPLGLVGDMSPTCLRQFGHIRRQFGELSPNSRRHVCELSPRVTESSTPTKINRFLVGDPAAELVADSSRRQSRGLIRQCSGGFNQAAVILRAPPWTEMYRARSMARIPAERRQISAVK